MIALVLAAGRSKRMKPVQDKGFLNFLGRPLVKWQVDMLWNCGFKKVVLVGGAHNLEALHNLDNDTPMEIDVVEQKNLDEGMKGAVLAAEEIIKDEPVLVFSGNDVVDKEAFEIVLKAVKSNKTADGFMLAKKVSDYFPGGYLELDENGFVTNIVEKPEPGTEPSDLINLVVHYFKNPKILIKNLKKAESENDDLYEKAVCAMIDEGAKIKALAYEGYWQAIKYPWHIQEVFKHLISMTEPKISDSAQISDKAVIEEPVVIDDDVRVMDGATVKGPCYLGKGTIVATNALVREANVGAGCVIGFSTEVARSYLGDNVWTHSNYIGDSVIGNDVSFGGGTVVGNLRLDEGIVVVDGISTGTNKFGIITGDHIRVGINASFMPGVRIGSESFIGAGIVIAQDIPEKSYVRGDFKLKISENKGSFSEEMREMMRKKL